MHLGGGQLEDNKGNLACTQSLNECGGSASVITDKVTPSPRLAQHLNLTHKTRQSRSFFSNPRISAASQARDSQIDSESKCATQEQQGGEVSEMNFVGYQARGAGSLLDINDQTPSVDSRESRSETNHTQKNFHFRDIFGNYHRFFRPYTRTLPPLKVRAFAHAYCYSHSSEILITASRKALISQTSYMTHEFAPPRALSTPRKILFVLKTCLKWLRFYTACPQRIDGTLAIMHQSSNYFHYLVESVSSMLQIIHSGLEVDYYVLDTSTPFAREMVEILQIPREKILSPKPHRLLRADSLLLPTLTADVETIEYRDRLLFAHALSLPLNIRDFYASLSTPTSYMSASHTPTSCPTRKVFLTRPMDSNRNIENLQEVQAVFGEFGYEIVLPDNLSLREQIALMRECKIIASMHGAGLANVLFAPSGAVVFEIFSEYYHDFGPQMCALLRKHRYMYMVGKTRDTSMHPQQENAYIHPEHLRHALKILEYESN